MSPRRTLALVLGWLALAAPAGAATRLYVNAFQTGEILAYDLQSGKLAGRLPVEDGAGSAYALAAPDGKTLYVIDGDAKHRLRVVDAGQLTVTKEAAFEGRRLNLGDGPATALTGDGRLLLVPTYDYGAAADGVRVFVTASGAFAPVGLRQRLCPAPGFTSAADGSVLQICADQLGLFRPDSAAPSELVQGPLLKSPGTLIAASLTPDGKNAMLLERAVAGKPWRLWRWATNEATPHVQALRGMPGAATAGLPAVGAELAMSASGRSLAVALGPRLWLLDVLNMRVQRSLVAPGAVERVAFTPDGKELLAFVRACEGGPCVAAFKIPGGEIRRVPLGELKLTGPLVSFVAAPAP